MRGIILVAVVAVLTLLVMSPTITGAIVSKNPYLSVNAGSTKGTLRFKNYDGKTVKIPFFTQDGNVYLGRDSDDILYRDGQTCAADCVSQQFLVIDGREAHIMKITNLENNLVGVKDITYGKETEDNLYLDGVPVTLSIGDVSFTLTINGNSMTFTDIGAEEVKLVDKGTLEIGSNFVYREPLGTTFPAEKYIGRGGSNPLTITVYYDTNINSMRISSRIIEDLTKTQGSGWFNTKGTYSYYSNKGTLITFTKYKLAVSK